MGNEVVEGEGVAEDVGLRVGDAEVVVVEVGEEVGEGVPVGDGVPLGDGVRVGVRELVGVDDTVVVGVPVCVGLDVGVCVGVLDGETGEGVEECETPAGHGVSLAEGVVDDVGVTVGVWLGVPVPVLLADVLGVRVWLGLFEGDGLGGGVWVGVWVPVFDGVGV